MGSCEVKLTNSTTSSLTPHCQIDYQTKKMSKSWTVQWNLLRCDHSNESSRQVLSNGSVHIVTEQSSCFCKLKFGQRNVAVKGFNERIFLKHFLCILHIIFNTSMGWKTPVIVVLYEKQSKPICLAVRLQLTVFWCKLWNVNQNIIMLNIKFLVFIIKAKSTAGH